MKKYNYLPVAGLALIALILLVGNRNSIQTSY